MPGAELPADTHVPDPMLAYRCGAGRALVHAPMRLEWDSTAWRNYLGIFARRYARHSRPGTVQWVTEQTGSGVLAPDYRYGLAVFGLGSARARVDYWRHERHSLPTAYLSDEDLASDLERAFGLAEEVFQALQSALWQLAQGLAWHRQGPRAPDMLRRVASGRHGSRAFWAALEVPARRLVRQLPGHLGHRDGVIRQWLAECERVARSEFRQTVAQAAPDAARLRAEALAEQHLRRNCLPPSGSRGGRRALRPSERDLLFTASSRG